MNGLRVLHLDTERGWRGGERQVLWLATGLTHAGHMSMIAARPGEPLARRARDAGLEVVESGPHFEADPVASLRLRTLIQRRGIQVVHAHTGHAVGLGAIATLGTRAKLVVTRRVDFPLRDNAGTRWKYGRAAAVIAISEAVARVLRTSPVPLADRLVVIPDGTDTTRALVPASTETLASLGVPAGAPLVVQVAQLVGHKDPLTFVRAFATVHAALPAARGLLVGDGALRGAVEREIGRLGLDGVVQLAGYRTDADQLLAAADVATLSSREEGMGSVLLDASLWGRPIVATDAGGIPEIVVDGETGVVVARESPAALGNAIVQLLRDRALARTLGERAQARVAEFSVERMVERTAEVYRRVL